MAAAVPHVAVGQGSSRYYATYSRAAVDPESSAMEAMALNVATGQGTSRYSLLLLPLLLLLLTLLHIPGRSWILKLARWRRRRTRSALFLGSLRYEIPTCIWFYF